MLLSVIAAVAVIGEVAVATLNPFAQAVPAAVPVMSGPEMSEPAPSGPVRIMLPARHYARLTLPNGQVRMAHSLLNITRPMHFGDYVWNDDHVPSGEVWIRIDLARQTLSVFRGVHEIGTALVLYGTDGKPTPTGVFPILEKAAQHRSTLYDAEMPFMLRLTGDGVAIHASNVREGSATHGCIGIPKDFARLLYGQMKRGDLVAILPAA